MQAQSRALLLLFEELGEKYAFSPQQCAEEHELGREEERKRKEEIEDIFLAMGTLVGTSVLEKAFQYTNQITELRAETSGRRVYWIKGKDETYKVLESGFCTCRSFVESRIGSAQPFCKHIVALHLAKLQNSIELKLLPDLEWGSKVWG